jgi:NDP-sugar pyrophosphorylase family protein
MKVSELFSEDMDPPFKEWLKKFNSLDELFDARSQLYARLNSQNIEGSVEEGALIVGPVHLGSGSVVQSQAVIRGPVLIGNDSFIGTHVEIRPGTFIGSGCRIDHGCSIMESILLNSSTIGPSSFIRNSIIGFACSVGPGAIVGAEKPAVSSGSLRRPSELGVTLGDHSAVAANSTVNPGTIVAPWLVIGERSLF